MRQKLPSVPQMMLKLYTRVINARLVQHVVWVVVAAAAAVVVVVLRVVLEEGL